LLPCIMRPMVPTGPKWRGRLDVHDPKQPLWMGIFQSPHLSSGSIEWIGYYWPITTWYLVGSLPSEIGLLTPRLETIDRSFQWSTKKRLFQFIGAPTETRWKIPKWVNHWSGLSGVISGHFKCECNPKKQHCLTMPFVRCAGFQGQSAGANRNAPLLWDSEPKLCLGPEATQIHVGKIQYRYY
jgi:hypothetical protein